MKNQHEQTRFILIWFYGLVLILIWLAVSGETMNQHVYQELDNYSNALGIETGIWIMQHSQHLYHLILVDTGFQTFLLKHTTPDGQMGAGLTKTLLFFKDMTNNLLTQILLLFLRITLLVVCLPFWGLILIAAVIDGCLIRKIRYHDFHYTSPLQNLWSRRLSQWIPGLFLYLLIVPLPIPVWLIPFMAVLTAICIGWWAGNWQKKI